MRAFFRLTLPPLLPVMLLLAFALITGWNIQYSPVEYLQGGTIDNGPELGAGAIILLSPIVYVVLLVLHAILIYVDRILKMSPLPFWTIVILIYTCALSAWKMNRQPVESPLFQEVVFAFVLSIIFFVPLAVTSVFLTRKLQQSEIKPIP